MERPTKSWGLDVTEIPRDDLQRAVHATHPTHTHTSHTHTSDVKREIKLPENFPEVQSFMQSLLPEELQPAAVSKTSTDFLLLNCECLIKTQDIRIICVFSA